MRLVLLGDPVEHSLSPAMHNAALAACGIEGSYEARAVDRAGLRTAMEEIRYGAIHGANVTMPHKEAAFRDTERPSSEALQAGAVNTLVADRGRVRGHNTDIIGVRQAWGEAGLPVGAPVLILGAGGAAAAAAIALRTTEVRLAARNPDAARTLLRRIRVSGEVLRWGTPVEGSVVVNATPLGMAGETLPAGLLDEAVGLFEDAGGDGTGHAACPGGGLVRALDRESSPARRDGSGVTTGPT